MRCLLTLLLTIGFLCLPAAAAERVLWTPTALQTTPDITSSYAGSLQALRKAAASTGRVRVIVGLRVPFAPEGDLSADEQTAQRNDIASTVNTLRARFAATIKRDRDAVRSYSTLPFMAMEVTSQELDRLATDPDIISISEDRQNSPSLAESTPLVRAPEAWRRGYVGSGQLIVIIDTGIDKSHPFLTSKVVAEACYSRRYCPGRKSTSTAWGSGAPCANRTECKHGTFVAGIAAGKGGSFSGVAPEANLISIQVFSRNGRSITAYDSDIIAALNRVNELRSSYQIAAVNLSLSGNTKYPDTCDSIQPSYAAAFATLRSVGIAPVVASGNNGWRDGLPAPACFSTAVSVGAVSDADWGLCSGEKTSSDKVTCYSNIAGYLSVLAPGSAITSSVPGGGYETAHGTSAAAAHVSGAFAALKQQVPEASVADELKAIQDNGQPITDYVVPFTTKPRLDVAASLDKFVTIFYRRDNGLGAVQIVTSGGSRTCFTNCSVKALKGTDVVITALPPPDTSVSWTLGPTLPSGLPACQGMGCNFTITNDTTFGINFFGPTTTINYVGTGSGSVRIMSTTGTLNCQFHCSMLVVPGSRVTVIAVPAEGSVLANWSGPCSGFDTCSFIAAPSTTFSAHFEYFQSLVYTKAGRGTGSVLFAPARSSSSCDRDCAQDYPEGTVVTLTAVPGPQAKFSGWYGACSGKGICVVTLTYSSWVQATFSGK